MKSKAALSASIALALEVLATPKSGNVDRFHDFEDLRIHDFVISSICSLPTFVKLEKREIGIGEAVYEAIKTSVNFHGEKNVHFGALLLLSPLVAAKGDVDEAYEVIREADWKQSLFIYKAFNLVNPRVLKAENLDLSEDRTEELIKRERLPLYEWMRFAPEENVIARELTEKYELSRFCKERITSWAESFGFERAIVIAYHELLSKVLDPLIVAKHGWKEAERVRRAAEKYLKEFDELKNFSIFMEFDELLISKRINPGSVADITSAGIYLALMEGVEID